ncbi:hypothetical protein TMatcc_002265 [Talaromyces marneffei ATCC 18224]
MVCLVGLSQATAGYHGYNGQIWSDFLFKRMHDADAGGDIEWEYEYAWGDWIELGGVSRCHLLRGIPCTQCKRLTIHAHGNFHSQSYTVDKVSNINRDTNAAA